MDSELLLWVAVFVGGYTLVVAWLLSVALRGKGVEEGEGPGPSGDGGARGGPAGGGPAGGGPEGRGPDDRGPSDSSSG